MPTQDYTTKRAKISRQISPNFKNKFKNSLKLEKIQRAKEKILQIFTQKKWGEIILFILKSTKYQRFKAIYIF